MVRDLHHGIRLLVAKPAQQVEDIGGGHGGRGRIVLWRGLAYKVGRQGRFERAAHSGAIAQDELSPVRSQ